MVIIEWNGRYVFGASLLGEAPKLTDNRDDAWVFPSEPLARRWIADFYGPLDDRLAEHVRFVPA